MPILESYVEKKAVEFAETMGYITFKVSPVSQRGWPDRVFINRYGYHIYIEIKRGGKKPRKLQRYRIQQLEERTVEVHWSDDLETIKHILTNGTTRRLYEHCLDTP